VASTRDSRGGRALLLGWLVAVFAISACKDPRLLAGAGVAAAALFHRGLARSLARVARSILPATLGLALASFLWLRVVGGAWPPVEPFAALVLRAGVIGLVTFSILERVDLLRALAPSPALSRLLVVTLAQIHALRLLATESREGLRSRMVRKPGVLDVVRGAGAVTGALVTLSARNAREISDAMRSRGF
jgi:cobalt/nickel transport system permease protein